MVTKNRTTSAGALDVSDVERTVKALADATRLRILGLLGRGEVCVCHIHESLGLPQSKVSRHLAYLRRAGLVTARKEGLWVYYSLAVHGSALDVVVTSVRQCLGHVAAAEKDRKRLEARTACVCSPADAMPVTTCCGSRTRSRFAAAITAESH
jgi:ArsR family transcriptional regulator, arsenate/arsenite/antimonite-responsive transcriptional repressor